MAPGVTVKEGITPGGLHLVGTGVSLYDGCLWGREMGDRGGGWLGILASPQLSPTSDRDKGGGPDGTGTVLSMADVGPAVGAGSCLPPQRALAPLP